MMRESILHELESAMEFHRIDDAKQSFSNYGLGPIKAELQILLNERQYGLDHQFYFDIIQRRAGLTLELGSSIGQRLLPYLLSGIHVHGVEVDPELFAVCQARAQKMGVVPTVHKQTLDRLDIPMSFKTIYAPVGIFEQLDSIETAELVLQKLFEHLEMNGVLIISLNVPPVYPTRDVVGVWRVVEVVQRAQDQARIVLSHSDAKNMTDQTIVRSERFDVFHASGDLESYLGMNVLRWYYKYEFKMLLERSGFSEISVLGDYSLNQAEDGHSVWVFLATKRG